MIYRPEFTAQQGHYPAQEIASPTAFYKDLCAIDQEFGDWYRRERWGDESGFQDRLNSQLSQTVGQYITVIRQNRATISPEILMRRDVVLRGSVDPVFAFLVRGMLGAQVMTTAVFGKVRDSWCYSDVPEDLGELLNIPDDNLFAAQFNDYSFFPGEQLKTSALQRMYVMSDLVREARV